MNSVVLKGKLGAGFNDDRYTLPKDGNPGDILIKTEMGSAWQKNESNERVVLRGYIWEHNGKYYICLNEEPGELEMMLRSGKDILLEVRDDEEYIIMRLVWGNHLFYEIASGREDGSGINSINITTVSEPTRPDPLWNCPYASYSNVNTFKINSEPS